MEPSLNNPKVDVVRARDEPTLEEAKNRTERPREVACSGKNGANIQTNLSSENVESITLRVRNMGVVTVKKEPGTEEDFEVSYSLSSLLDQCDFQSNLPLKQPHRHLKSPTSLSSTAAKPRKRLESVINSLKSAKRKDGQHTKKLKAPENRHVPPVISISSPSKIVSAAPKSIAPPSTSNIIDTQLSGPKDRNVPQIVDVRSLATVAKVPISSTTAYKHTYVASPQPSVQPSQAVSSVGGKQVINIARVNASGTPVQGLNTQSKSVGVPAPINIRFVLPSLIPFNKDYFQKALQAALAAIGSSSLQLDPNQLQQAIQAALTAIITSTSTSATNKSLHQPIHLPATFKASAVTSSQTTAPHHNALQMSHWQPQGTTKTTVSPTAQVSIPVVRPSSHFPVKVVPGSEKSLPLPKSLLSSTTMPVVGLADSRQSLLSSGGAGHNSNPTVIGMSGPSLSSPCTSQVSASQSAPLTDARQSLTRALDSQRRAYSWEPLGPLAGASGIVTTPLDSPTAKSHCNDEINSLAPLSSMPVTLLASGSPRDPISGVLEKSQVMNGGSVSSSPTSIPSSVSMQSLVVSDKVALSSTAEDTQVLSNSVLQLGSQNDAPSLTSCAVSTTNSKISVSSSGALVQSSSSSTSSGNSGSTLQISINTANAVSGSNPGQAPFIVLDSPTYMANKEGPSYSSGEAQVSVNLPISHFSAEGSLPIMQPNSVTLNHASSVAGATGHSSWASAERPTMPGTSSLDDQAVAYTTDQSSNLVSGSSIGKSLPVQQSAVQLPAASNAPPHVHLVPTAAQKSRKQRKALYKELGEQLADCECEVCHQTHDVQDAVDVELGPDGKLKCKYTTCKKTYSSKAGLWKHYYFHLLHGMKVPQEKASLSCDTFLPPQLSSLYRKARLRELFKRLTDEEVQELILPRLAKSLSLFELLIQKSSRIHSCRTISSYKMFNEFERFRKQVEQKLTEMIEQAEKDKNVSADTDNKGVNDQETSEEPDKSSQPRNDIGETAKDTDEPVCSSAENTEKNSPSVKPVEPEEPESQPNKDVSVNSVNSSCVETVISSSANSSSVMADSTQANPISKLDSSLKMQTNYKGEQVQQDIKSSTSSSHDVLSVESGSVSKNSVCTDSKQEHPEVLPVDVEHGPQVESGLLLRDPCNCEDKTEEITSGVIPLEQHSGSGGEGSTLEATTKETHLKSFVGEGIAQVESEKTSVDVNQTRCEEAVDGNRGIYSENKEDVGSQQQEDCSVISSEDQRKVSQVGVENQHEDVSSTRDTAESSTEGTDEKRTKAVEDSDKVKTKPSNTDQAEAHEAGIEETKKSEKRTEKQKDETLETLATSSRTGIIVETRGEDGALDQTGQESSVGLLENASSDRQVPILDPVDSSLGSRFHSRTKECLVSLSGTETASENECLAALDDEDVFGFRIPFMLKRAKLMQGQKAKYKRKFSPVKRITDMATGEDLRKFILLQPRDAAMVVLKATTNNDKSFFRNHVMPALLESNLAAFSMLGQNLISQLFLTRKAYEQIFRWGLGPKLAEVLGINIFPTYKRVADFTKGPKTGDEGEESSAKNDNADDLDVDEMPAKNDQSEDVYQGLPKLRKKRKAASKPPNEPNKKQKPKDTNSAVQNAQSQTEKKNKEGSGEFTVETSETSSAGPPIEAIMHVDASQFSFVSRPPTKQGSSAPENTSAEGKDQNSEKREPLRSPGIAKPAVNSQPGSSAAATCGISSSVTVTANTTVIASNASSCTLPVVPLPSTTGAPLFLIPAEKVSTDLLTKFIKSGQESLQAGSSSDKSKDQQSSVVLVLVPSTSSTGTPTIQTLTSSSQLETSGGRKPLLLIPSEKVPSSVVGQSNTVRRTMIITMVAGSGSKANTKTESTTNVSGVDSHAAIVSSVAGLQTDATSATQSLPTPVMSPGLGEPLSQAASPLLTEHPVLSGVTSSATSSVSSKVIPGDGSKISAVSTSLHTTSSSNADDPTMSVSNEVKNLTSVVRNTSAVNLSLESGLGSGCEHSLDAFSSSTTSPQVTQPSNSDIHNIPLTDPSQTLGITVTVVTTVPTASDGQETASNLLSGKSALTSVGDLARNVSDFQPVDVVLSSNDRSFADDDKDGGTATTNACTAPSVTVKASSLNPPCDSEKPSESDIDEQSVDRCEEASFCCKGDHTYAIVRRQSPRKSAGCVKGNLERSIAPVSGSTSEDSDSRMMGHEYSLRKTSLSASGSSKVKEQSDDGTPPRKRRRGPTLRSSVRETSVTPTTVPDRVLRGSPSKSRERK